MALLCCLANQGAPMTVKSLAELTSQPVSTDHRHLRQLLAWGLVSEREDGTYAPDPQAERLHQGFKRRNEPLHEPIEPGFLLGAVLVIVGISLVRGHGWLLTLLQRSHQPVPGAVNR